MLFGGACTKIHVFFIHLPMYCTSRLIKGLDDRRTNPEFGGAATKILVSSQIAQKRHLRPVWASESFALNTFMAKQSVRSWTGSAPKGKEPKGQLVHPPDLDPFFVLTPSMLVIVSCEILVLFRKIQLFFPGMRNIWSHLTTTTLNYVKLTQMIL